MDKLVIVNRMHPLPKSYVPDGLIKCDDNENNFHGFLDPNEKPRLRYDALKYFKELRKEALKNKYDIIVGSGYRSFDYQARIVVHNYEKYLKELEDETLAFKKTLSRVQMPGCSEHQTGLAFDVDYFRNGILCSSEEETEEYKWMQDNSYRYGFILRYPENKESITGITYEPWHYRFVGIKDAKRIYNSELTLEEYHELVLKK